MSRLFVYGSLKQGCSNAGELAGARLLGAARTAPGYTLVRYVDGYPALTRRAAPSAVSGRVQGELYELSEEHLRRIDEFEEAPRLYQRELVELELGERAYAYVISEAEAARWELLATESWQEGASHDP